MLSVLRSHLQFAPSTLWVDRDKPKFDISEHFSGFDVTVDNRYNAIFDMIAYAFQTDMTRVASVAFPNELKYTDIEGVTRSYHGLHAQRSKRRHHRRIGCHRVFSNRSIVTLPEEAGRDSGPLSNADGSMLDHTVVLFGSGMGYGGTHSNRNLPIMVAGGGFQAPGAL